jgi:hypothetical protein
MKSSTGFALLILCSAGLFARGLAAQGAAGAPFQTDPASDDGQLAPWRTLLDSDKATLGQVRELFLRQDIIVGGTVEDLGRNSQLLEWRIAAKPSDSIHAADAEARRVPRPARYVVPNALDGLPVRYSGKTAQVIAIQWHDSQVTGAVKNALGEAVSDDGAINPCFDLVVQFNDGTTAMTTQYPATLATANVAELASVVSAAAERLQRELPYIAGTYVYAAGFTQLYRPDSSLDELARQDASKRLAPADIPLFEPLPIVTAKYVAPAGVVIEVQLPNGNKALSLTSTTQLFSAPINGEKQTFLDRVIGLFLSQIPSDLSKKEAAAIRSGSIYRGMREGALEYVLGFPDKESKGEEGGKQLVFRKSLVVHVGADGRVADWKFVDEK